MTTRRSRSSAAADGRVIADGMAARRRTIRRSGTAALICVVAVVVMTIVRQQRFDRVEEVGTRVVATVESVTEWELHLVWPTPPGDGRLKIDVPDRTYRSGQQVPIKVHNDTGMVHVPGEGTEDVPLDAFLTVGWTGGVIAILITAEMGLRYRFVQRRLASAPRHRVRVRGVHTIARWWAGRADVASALFRIEDGEVERVVKVRFGAVTSVESFEDNRWEIVGTLHEHRRGVLIGRGPVGPVLAEYVQTRLPFRQRAWERRVR